MEAIDNYCRRGGSSAGEGGNSDLRASYDAPDGAYAATCEIGESLELGFDGYMPPGRNWGMLGEHLAQDVRLKELLVCDLEVEMVEGDFAPVFRGIGANRSLRKLSFHSVDGLAGAKTMLCALRPLFSRHMLECLKIHQCALGSEGLRALTSMLSEGSLTHFELCDDVLSGRTDQALGELVHALSSSHRGRLRTLVLHGHRFGPHGCTALRALLRPGSKLVTLGLQGNRFEDEGSFVSLARSFSWSSALRELDLSCNRGVSVNGWATVLSALRSPDCRLEKLSLRSNVIGDRVLNLASVILSQNNTLKSLDISHTCPCSHAAWETLFNAIRRPSCAVDELVLSGNRFAKDASLALSVKSLCLSEISFDGWHSFSAALCHSSTEKLVLHSSLNDAAVGHVTGALVNNSCLRELDLRNCREVSAAIWEACLPAVFQSSWSRLEKVDLTGNAINDDTMVSIANSLGTNKTLTSLVMNDLFGTITDRGLAAISRLLCNSSSAMNAYNSNHTLQSLCEENIEFLLPKHIRELLILNREHGRKEAARFKILRYHFGSSDVIMRTFLDMEKVLPDAIAWMGRDALNGNESREGSGLSLLYQVLPLVLGEGPVIETEQSPKRRKLES